ncbi:MAG: hypothetical protein FWC09_11140 [Lachnospiraceae bacterium]|nr:hypothetical protein [Lachnospiraceae bacterium]
MCNSKQTAATKIETALIEYFSTYEEVFISDSEEAARIEKERQKTDAQIKGFRDKLAHLDKREKEKALQTNAPMRCFHFFMMKKFCLYWVV